MTTAISTRIEARATLPPRKRRARQAGRVRAVHHLGQHVHLMLERGAPIEVPLDTARELYRALRGKLVGAEVAVLAGQLVLSVEVPR